MLQDTNSFCKILAAEVAQKDGANERTTDSLTDVELIKERT